jgi:hypothetical protein
MFDIHRKLSVGVEKTARRIARFSAFADGAGGEKVGIVRRRIEWEILACRRSAGYRQ